MKLETIPRSKLSAIVSALVLYLFSLGVGIWGIDFGSHWDEPITLASVRESFRTGLFLPHQYFHNSMTYDVGIVTAAAFLVSKGVHMPVDTVEPLKEPSFHLAFRTACLAISLLSIFWCGIGAWTLSRGNPFATITAMGLLAGSWEFGYHARWIAPDTLLASFASLTFCLLILAVTKKSLNWLILAATTAGLSFGSKQPGSLLLLPVLAGSFSVKKPFPIHYLLGLLVAVFCAAFVISTPGALIEPAAVLRSNKTQFWRYGASGHGGYSVVPGLPHLGLIFQYLAFSAFSKYWSLSFVAFALSVLGGGAAFQRAVKERRVNPGSLTAAFLILFVLYFSTQKVLIVRNLMLLLPLLALLAAEGFLWITDRRRQMAPVAFGVLLVIGMINFTWLAKASATIPRYRDDLPIPASEFPDGALIWASASLRERVPIEMRSKDRKQAQFVLYQSIDIPDWGSNWMILPANRRGTYRLLSSGPYEVNYDYYPSWDGPARPILVAREIAATSGLFDLLKD